MRYFPISTWAARRLMAGVMASVVLTALVGAIWQQSAAAARLPDGSFISFQGATYRVAGGAPIYVSTCVPFPAACTNPTPVADLSEYNQFPADGTFIRGAQTQEIYRIAGGAPIYVTTCAQLGCVPFIDVDQAAIDNAGSGGVFNHLRFFPADGTILRAVGSPNGDLYIVAGGAPLYIADCAPLNGCPNRVDVDASAIDNAGSGRQFNHLRYFPADGTFIRGAQTGEIYRIVGGAPVYVGNCAPLGGCTPFVNVDQAAINNASNGEQRYSHLRFFPADGSFIRAAGTGEIYRIAGGAPVRIFDCAPFNGCPGLVDVDPAAITNAGGSGVFAHLRRVPADNTVLQGVPSNVFWRIVGGCRRVVDGPQSGAVQVNDASLNAFAICGTGPEGDFDGDAKSDLAVYRPSSNTWFVNRSGGGAALVTTWGVAGDVPVAGDYDGDGKDDVAVFRPSTGVWYVLRSTGGVGVTVWGVNGDIPEPADYDGDGKVDIAVYRPTTGEWFIQKSSGGSTVTVWGVSTDIPVAGDYDGDGRADIAVYRPSTGDWFIQKSTGGSIVTRWGVSTDVPVVDDYDGDGKDDIAVYRPGSPGEWYILRSTAGPLVTVWGLAGDIPVPNDYDGDGKADIAVFRPSSGVWFIQRSTGGIITPTWGVSGDVPVPLPYAIGNAYFNSLFP